MKVWAYLLQCDNNEWTPIQLGIMVQKEIVAESDECECCSNRQVIRSLMLVRQRMIDNFIVFCFGQLKFVGHSWNESNVWVLVEVYEIDDSSSLCASELPSGVTFVGLLHMRIYELKGMWILLVNNPVTSVRINERRIDVSNGQKLVYSWILRAIEIAHNQNRDLRRIKFGSYLKVLEKCLKNGSNQRRKWRQKSFWPGS